MPLNLPAFLKRRSAENHVFRHAQAAARDGVFFKSRLLRNQSGKVEKVGMQQQSVDVNDLTRLVAAAGADLPAAAAEPLAVYLEMLCRWERGHEPHGRANLAGGRDPSGGRQFSPGRFSGQPESACGAFELGSRLRRWPARAFLCALSGPEARIISLKCAKNAPFFFPACFPACNCPPPMFFGVLWSIFSRGSIARQTVSSAGPSCPGAICWI